jgi:hypothetical protein
MKQSLLKMLTITISLALYLYSFSYDAFSYNYQGIKNMSSLEAFLMGSIALLGGGNFEWLIWLANPLCFIAILCLMFDKKSALYFASVSIVLSLSFLSSNTILAAESGARGEILSVKSGYYIWLSSIVIFTIGIYLYFKNHREIKYED